ncbi:MAG: hypothetical protein M3374_01115 [Pseudomonadota bacterium]|nr:hypothetical protein [Pseudomonadota bacterium]
MSDPHARFRFLAVASAVVLILAGCATDRGSDLERWMRRGYSESYRSPITEERAHLVAGFASGFAVQDATPFRQLGYVDAQIDGSLALHETTPAVRGWGAYAFRLGGGRRLILQAPHSESDIGTARIGIGLYALARGRAVALNSAHRSLPDADQAGAGDTPFLLFTQEALRAGPDTLVVQLHGFGEATALKYALTGETMVASNGTREPDPALRTFAACARGAGIDVRLFPEEAAYPGGTRNAVGRLVRNYPEARFMHLEMGASLRASLVREPSRLQAFAACL